MSEMVAILLASMGRRQKCGALYGDVHVRNLGIFMFNLIQKNSSKFVIINMCTYELLVAMLIMFRSTKTLLKIETVRLEVYPTEGPILKALAASLT